MGRRTRQGNLAHQGRVLAHPSFKAGLNARSLANDPDLKREENQGGHEMATEVDPQLLEKIRAAAQRRGKLPTPRRPMPSRSRPAPRRQAAGDRSLHIPAGDFRACRGRWLLRRLGRDPSLHTPLMSVTNAISSVIVVGALLSAALMQAQATVQAQPVYLASSRSLWLRSIFLAGSSSRAHVVHVQEEGLNRC